MRTHLLVCMLTLLFVSCARSADPSRADIDKQLVDTLKDLHNRGADLFNSGEPRGAYRLFQGTLLTTRAVLTHRPDEQKFIDEAIAAAERLPTIDERAFVLHRTIQNLRNRLKAPAAKEGVAPELLLPPREDKDPPKKFEPPKDGIMPERLLPPREHKEEPKKLEPPQDGVMGRLMWQGKPLDGVIIQFVSRGDKALIREAKSNSDGVYILPNVSPGQYTVVLSAPDGGKPLPERYSTSNTSPLIVDVKGGGDTLDFLLQ